MKIKGKHFMLYFLVGFLMLTGCSGQTVESESATADEVETEQEVVVEEVVEEVEKEDDKAYEIAIENGLKELENEDFEQAIVYFEIALEEKPEDDRASDLIEQTENYVEAWDLFYQVEYEKSRVKAEEVKSFEGGSDALTLGADQVLIEIDHAEEIAKKEELEAIEAAEAEAAEKAESEELTNEVQTSEPVGSPYNYSDFVGYYLHFNSADRSHSDMIATIGHEHLTIGWWMSEFELYDILDWSLNGNVLTIEYYLQPFYEEEEGIYGTMTVQLLEENGERFIDFGSDMPFYKATYDEVQNYQYTIQDYLYADIHQ